MDQLAAMKVFVDVVEARGFTAASRISGVPLPTISRRIDQLESLLGVKLLLRTTRQTVVTDSGREYYAQTKRILDEIENAARVARGDVQNIKGQLRITAPSTFGRLYLLPIVREFLDTYPETEIVLIATNQVLDPIAEHIDLSLRIGEIESTTAQVVDIGEMHEKTVASPAYLRAHGRPTEPGDLYEHDVIMFSSRNRQVPWCYGSPTGGTKNYLFDARIFVNTAEAALDCALADMGVVNLFHYQALEAIRRKLLSVVLDDYAPDPHPVSFIAPERDPAPRKLSAFIDFALPRLRQQLSELAQSFHA